MKRIDIFMPPLSNFGVLHHYTTKFYEALMRTGIKCRLLEAKRDDPGPFLKALMEDKPDCTLSFNGLLPDDQGRFFCDMIQIPHVAYLVDSPNSYVPLTRSNYSIIISVDQFGVDFFKGLGFNRLLFLPYGIESTLKPDEDSKREYSVVLLSSCIDYEGLVASWEEKYGAVLKKVMEETAEEALVDTTVPYYTVFVSALDRHMSQMGAIDPRKLDVVSMLEEVEMFIRGKDRVDLIRAIKDAPVDIFGSAYGSKGWGKYLVGKKNVTVHDPVPFEQALEIMKHAKILLNSSPWMRYGVHERVLAGFACGALVISDENPYLCNCFEDGKSIVLYQHSRLDKANHRVNEYLESEVKRKEIAAKGREVVMDSQTWDDRAQKLVKELPALLKKIPG